MITQKKPYHAPLCLKILAGALSNIAVSSLNTKRTRTLEKYLSEKLTHIRRSQKSGGLSYTNQEKSGQSYTFCWKKGANPISGSTKKGAHSARTSLLCYLGSYLLLPLSIRLNLGLARLPGQLGHSDGPNEWYAGGCRFESESSLLSLVEIS